MVRIRLDVLMLGKLASDGISLRLTSIAFPKLGAKSFCNHLFKITKDAMNVSEIHDYPTSFEINILLHFEMMPSNRMSGQTIYS